MNEQTEQVANPADISLMMELEFEIDKRVALALIRVLSAAYDRGNSSRVTQIATLIRDDNNGFGAGDASRAMIGSVVGGMLVETLLKDGTLASALHNKLADKIRY